ncbi:MAG: M81 family metallopeptidase [Hyphomicrobiales bacterium]|nr:M81 family metallopeptidase [Hyphomicrobiales bacterium]
MIHPRRIVLAGFFHETHTFVSGQIGLDEFTIYRGESLLEKRGDGSPIDGFLEIADKENWSVVPIVDYTVLPGATIEHAAFEAFWRELEAGLTTALADGPVDGIWLALHGAAVTTECEDVEGELLSRIRRLRGFEALPIFGVFDLHATFTAAMAKNANGLVGYRENPHIDARDSAVRSAELMARALRESVVPHMVSRNAPVIWPPTGTGTADSPMRDLERLARSIEAGSSSIWAVNVVGGFAFADVTDAGVAFSIITTGNDAEAEAALHSLVDLAVSLRERGVPDEWDLDDALVEASKSENGPVIIVEPADNIGGGSGGDCTAVLRALLRHGTDNAAVAIADPEAVTELQDVKPGETSRIRIGGKRSQPDQGPVTVDATLVRLSGGRFTLEDRNSHLAASQGVSFDMGPCAVVKIEDKVTVLLTSRKTPPFDLAQFRTQGIEPEALSVIGVKAAAAHRRAYDPIAAASYTVSTAGPCASDLRKLPYRRVRRPIFPLDPIQ